MRKPLPGKAAGIMPARAELAAATDVGLDAGSAALQPQLADPAQDPVASLFCCATKSSARSPSISSSHRYGSSSGAAIVGLSSIGTVRTPWLPFHSQENRIKGRLPIYAAAWVLSNCAVFAWRTQVCVG